MCSRMNVFPTWKHRVYEIHCKVTKNQIKFGKWRTQILAINKY